MEQQTTPQPPAPSAQMEKINLKILLADDYQGGRELFTDFLQSIGHTVKAVENGQLLIDELYKPGAVYDLILTDNNMPVKDGIEAIREVRSREEKENSKAIPIILLTALPNSSIEKEVVSLGAIFLTKPVSLDVLKEKIEELVK